MSFVTRQAAHCDICGHEWLTAGQPTHCAKCKSRKWNSGQIAPILQKPTRFMTKRTFSPKNSGPEKVKVDCYACGHEWLVVAAQPPARCAKCKSRKWNTAPKHWAGEVWNASPHDPKTCRFYKCGMCAAAKGGK